MNARVMNAYRCDIAHETLLLKEFREAMADARLEAERSAQYKGGPASAPEEMIENFKFLQSSAFPKCP
jgi:hypothetical protein